MRNGVIEATVDMDQVNNLVLDMTGHESLDCNTLDFLFDDFSNCGCFHIALLKIYSKQIRVIIKHATLNDRRRQTPQRQISQRLGARRQAPPRRTPTFSKRNNDLMATPKRWDECLEVGIH